MGLFTLTHRNRAQIWGFDLISGVVIFSVALVFYYFYSLNIGSTPIDKIESLKYEGERFSEIILSEGYPYNWTSENVIEPGILMGDKISTEMIFKLVSLVNNNYSHTKNLLKIPYEFMIVFEDPIEISGLNISYIGPVDPENINARNLANIKRIGVYQNRPIKINFYIWE